MTIIKKGREISPANIVLSKTNGYFVKLLNRVFLYDIIY